MTRTLVAVMLVWIACSQSVLAEPTADELQQCAFSIPPFAFAAAMRFSDKSPQETFSAFKKSEDDGSERAVSDQFLKQAINSVYFGEFANAPYKDVSKIIWDRCLNAPSQKRYTPLQ